MQATSPPSGLDLHFAATLRPLLQVLKVIMYKCPHCGVKTISAWKKLSAGRAMPAKCTNCGGNSYIRIKDQIVGQVLLSVISLIFIMPAIALGDARLAIGIIPLSIFILKPLLLNKPLEKVT